MKEVIQEENIEIKVQDVFVCVKSGRQKVRKRKRRKNHHKIININQ